MARKALTINTPSGASTLKLGQVHDIKVYGQGGKWLVDGLNTKGRSATLQHIEFVSKAEGQRDGLPLIDERHYRNLKARVEVPADAFASFRSETLWAKGSPKAPLLANLKPGIDVALTVGAKRTVEGSVEALTAKSDATFVVLRSGGKRVSVKLDEVSRVDRLGTEVVGIDPSRTSKGSENKMSFLKAARTRLQGAEEGWSSDKIQVGRTTDTLHPRGTVTFEVGKRYNLEVVGAGAGNWKVEAIEPKSKRMTLSMQAAGKGKATADIFAHGIWYRDGQMTEVRGNFEALLKAARVDSDVVLRTKGGEVVKGTVVAVLDENDRPLKFGAKDSRIKAARYLSVQTNGELRPLLIDDVTWYGSFAMLAKREG